MVPKPTIKILFPVLCGLFLLLSILARGEHPRTIVTQTDFSGADANLLVQVQAPRNPANQLSVGEGLLKVGKLAQRGRIARRPDTEFVNVKVVIRPAEKGPDVVFGIARFRYENLVVPRSYRLSVAKILGKADRIVLSAPASFYVAQGCRQSKSGMAKHAPLLCQALGAAPPRRH
jgi:hypothetical protein